MPDLPVSNHVYVGPNTEPLHLYTSEQMKAYRAEVIEMCAKEVEMWASEPVGHNLVAEELRRMK